MLVSIVSSTPDTIFYLRQLSSYVLLLKQNLSRSSSNTSVEHIPCSCVKEKTNTFQLRFSAQKDCYWVIKSIIFVSHSRGGQRSLFVNKVSWQFLSEYQGLIKYYLSSFFLMKFIQLSLSSFICFRHNGVLYAQTLSIVTTLVHICL